MRLFVISDIHGAKEPFEAAAPLLQAADWVVAAGDLTRGKTRVEAAEIIACIERYSNRILAVHGNWDRPEAKDLLEEKGYSLHGTGRILDGVGFFGLGGSSPTPMNTATEYTEEEIGVFLQRGYERVRQAPRVVLISHAPPRGVRDRSFLGLRGGSVVLRRFWQRIRCRCACAATYTRRRGSNDSMRRSWPTREASRRASTCPSRSVRISW